MISYSPIAKDFPDPENTEFNQRAQAIFDRMDKSLSKLDRSKRVPVSVLTSENFMFPVDVSLRVCLPVLAGVLAWNIAPAATIPAVVVGAGLEWATETRHSISTRIKNLLIKACGRTVPADPHEISSIRHFLNTSPSPISKAIQRYMDPDNASIVTANLDTPTLDHATIIYRAIDQYRKLAGYQEKEALVVDGLQKRGLIDEARAFNSHAALVAAVFAPVTVVPDASDMGQETSPASRPRRI